MDVLCFGIIVVDHRRREEHAQEVLSPLRIVDKAVDLHMGGIPIVSIALKQMGFAVGLMGNVSHDIAGYGLKSYLGEEIGINIEAVKTIDTPTSSSFIRLTDEQRYVDHTPGASSELSPGNDEINFVVKNKPKLMAIGYAGLLPKMDNNEGKEMADWTAHVQARGTLVALDCHTVPPYQMLNKPGRLADIFICNLEEGEGITGVIGSGQERVLSAIWAKFPPQKPSRYRLFGLTLPKGIQLAYGNQNEFDSKWFANSYYGTFVPEDLTGAGDYFRAGLYAYITRHLKDFSSGQLDLEDAANHGFYVASQCLAKGVQTLPLFHEIKDIL